MLPCINHFFAEPRFGRSAGDNFGFIWNDIVQNTACDILKILPQCYLYDVCRSHMTMSLKVNGRYLSYKIDVLL